LRTKYFLSIILVVILLCTTLSLALAQTSSEGDGGGAEFESGESHCSLGGLGFIVLLATLFAGFLVSGRFGRIKGIKPLPVHKVVVVILALFLTGEFIYGSTVQKVVFIYSLHGTLGFLSIALAWLTVSLNPLWLGKIIKWKRASRVHLIFASSLLTVLIIHLFYAFLVFGD
jgi:hypothetical protein